MAFDISLLSIPQEIISCIQSLTDIVLDKYSDKGGNGYLFFGHHKILNTRIAMKFYGIDRLQPCHDEPVILNGLNHENILRVHDARKISQDYACFITPEVNGGDLDKFLCSNVVSTKMALEITRGILSGLSELHRDPNRLLHRDLKPGNILVDNTCHKPIIADFGSIKRLPEGNAHLRASRHAFICLPPEAIKEGEYCFQSDIYQVGIILFQLLYGYFPYQEKAWLSERQKTAISKIDDNFERQDYWKTQVSKLIKKGTLLDFSTLPIYVSRGIKKIIRWATHPDRESRYQTPSIFLRAIHDYSANATDWHQADKVLVANTKDRGTFRIFDTKKGIKVEKQYAGNSWRAYNRLGNSFETIISDLNGEN
jgi:serine/threonine protein kinase